MNNNFGNAWPYLEAKNYSDWDSILQVFPHLKNINPNEHIHSNNVNGIVIRSANDDNVHKVSILLARPSSTASGPRRPKTKIE